MKFDFNFVFKTVYELIQLWSNSIYFRSVIALFYPVIDGVTLVTVVKVQRLDHARKRETSYMA